MENSPTLPLLILILSTCITGVTKDEALVIKASLQSLILSNGNKLPLQVGMSLKANIKLRKVSYLKLLLGSFRDKAESIKSI